jgi:hypothetical protein
MLSIERSKEILNKGERKYTDDEIKRMREVLYILAELEYDIFSQEPQPSVKNQPLKTKNNKP